MKIFLRGALFIICMASVLKGSSYEFLRFRSPNLKTSQSFMFTHPIYQNVPAWQSVWHNFIYNKRGPLKASFQIRGMYQQSLSDERTIQYFLPRCRTELLVEGDCIPTNEMRDIRAEWLGINNPHFRGRMTINPCQRQLAVILDYNQDLSCILKNLPFIGDAWVSFTAPIVAVDNNINLRQFDVNGLGDCPAQDIISAFNQPAWRYAKIRPTGHSRLGLAELTIRFGRAYLACDDFEVIYYTGVSLPTANGQNADYIFNPFLGNNGHLGFITGVNFQIVLNRDNSAYSSCLFINFESIFLIRGNEYRTIDLKGKPWSRYLLLNKKNGPPDQFIPGANILTQNVTVRPFNRVDFSTGWRFINNYGEFEIGYGIWGKPDERIELTDCFQEIYGIAGCGPLDPCAQVLTASSASKSTIACLAPNDVDDCGCPIFVPIKKTDLNLKSASARASLNHRGHAAYGFFNYGETIDTFLGMGFYAEFPQKNTTLTLWGFWFKAGGSF
ncbi:MAG: hypothetical protein ACOYT8_02715 [Candidatus Dependentiae bacterium]